MGWVQFRQATVEDAGTLLAIKRAAIGGIDNGVYDQSQIDAWQPDEDATADFERAITSETFDVILAVAAETSAAYGVLNASAGRIDAVYVRPRFQGEGIATSLVGQLESRARMHGVDELTIVASLNAGAFYEKLDYWDFGSETRTIDGVDVEFAIMRKHLDNRPAT